MPTRVMQVNRLSQQHSAMSTTAVVMGAAMIAAVAGPDTVAGQPLTYSELLQTPLSLRPLSGLTVADATDAEPLPQGVARSLARPRFLDTQQGQLARLLRPQRGLVRDVRGGQVHLLLSRPDRFHHLRDGMIERPERASVVWEPS